MTLKGVLKIRSGFYFATFDVKHPKIFIKYNLHFKVIEKQEKTLRLPFDRLRAGFSGGQR